MARISRTQMFMQFARVASLRSTCMRLNVGCVIVEDNRRVVSVGYNGAPPGEPHCTGSSCPGKFHCTRTTHAEKNALEGISFYVDKTYDLYTTHSPCGACCRMIEWTPIQRVYFETPFREADHLDRFRDQWQLYQLTPAGYVMEWFSKEVIELA